MEHAAGGDEDGVDVGEGEGWGGDDDDLDLNLEGIEDVAPEGTDE